MYKGPLFSPSRSIIVFPCLFYHTNSNMYVVIAHCGFDLHFPNDYWCGISFLILVGHVHVFFGEMFIPTLCPFKKSGCFCYWVVWVLYIFWILTPHQIHGLHIIFPIPTQLRFHSLVSCVVEKLLILMLSHLDIFTFVTCAFGVLSKKCPMSHYLKKCNRTFPRNFQCHTTSKNTDQQHQPSGNIPQQWQGKHCPATGSTTVPWKRKQQARWRSWETTPS